MSLDDNIKDATQTVSKAGAWAVLAVGLIVAIGWFIVIIAKRGDMLVSDYLGAQKVAMKELASASKSNADATSKVADAVTTLVGFHDDVAEQHHAMLMSLTALQDSIVGSEQRETLAAEKLDELISLMQVANEMMAKVPSARNEQVDNQLKMLKLLDDISVGIQQLRVELKSCAVQPEEELQEP